LAGAIGGALANGPWMPRQSSPPAGAVFRGTRASASLKHLAKSNRPRQGVAASFKRRVTRRPPLAVTMTMGMSALVPRRRQQIASPSSPGSIRWRRIRSTRSSSSGPASATPPATACPFGQLTRQSLAQPRIVVDDGDARLRVGCLRHRRRLGPADSGSANPDAVYYLAAGGLEMPGSNCLVRTAQGAARVNKPVAMPLLAVVHATTATFGSPRFGCRERIESRVSPRRVSRRSGGSERVIGY
jgi:hypothetical protein